MNEKMKKQLETMIVAMVNEDVATSNEASRAYIKAKARQILMGESAEEKDEDDEDEDEKEEDEKEEDDEDEDEDKDDKKVPPFMKKSKKDKD